MNYLDTIIKKIKLADDGKSDIKDDLNIVYEKIIKNEIKFIDENFEISFYNHIVALIKRLRDKDLVEPIDDSLMGEIPEKTIEFSKYLVEDIFKLYNTQIDKTEIFLVATHIQLTLNYGG